MDLAQLYRDMQAILPEMILAVTALLALILDFLTKCKKSYLACLSVAGISIAVISVWGIPTEGLAFSRLLHVDLFALLYKLVFLSAGAMVILISGDYLDVQNKRSGEYYVLVLLATLGMMVMAAAANFLTMYLGLELSSLCFYILCGLQTKDARSNEAALKYFVLGLMASAILIYGISLIYGATGSLSLIRIEKVLSGQPEGWKSIGLIAGMTLTLVGLSFKIAAVPFHMWAPDVYEGAPTPVAAFMSVGPKIAAFAALLRVLVALFPLSVQWGGIFAVISVLTMTVGNLLALRQESVKRMLAYSGIAHVGYALIGVVAGAYSKDIGLSSALLYFLMYFMANLGAFGVLAVLCRGGHTGETYEELKGLAANSPPAAFFMTIFIFSLLGIPPTGGFIGKLWVFAAAVKSDLMWLAAVGLVNALISTYYYLRVIVMMYMHEPEAEQPAPAASYMAYSALAIMAVVTVFMGANPRPFIELAQRSMAAII